MVSDSIANVSSSSALPNAKEFGKRRREGNSRPKSFAETSNDRDNERLFVCPNSGHFNREYDDILMIDCETESESSSIGSPTSVLTSKGSWKKSGGAFCCSGLIGEQDDDEEDEDMFYDAVDDTDAFFDALSSFDDNIGSSSHQETWNYTPEQTENLDKDKQGMSLTLSEAKIHKQPSCPMEHCPKFVTLPENDNAEQLPCPVCYEDMDATDLSFFPCPCGFQICLFCHKTLTEDGNRCPGCRRLYNQALSGHSSVTFL